MTRYKIQVTFPNSGETRTVRSVHAVARMLSGTGTASGGLRQQIVHKANEGYWGHDNIVRRHAVVG